MQSLSVNLSRCAGYDSGTVYQQIDLHLGSIAGRDYQGKTVLVKPNLITARAPVFACTDADFLLETARWLVDHGAKVRVGDSPAYGTALSVLKYIGAFEGLRRLGVDVDEFRQTRVITLSDKTTIKVAAAAYECDELINLPKIKAHNQMYVTLALKNLFGLVKGYKKAILHISHGQSRQIFSQMLLELVDKLPQVTTLADGIEVMHKAGPIKGEKLFYGLMASAENPIALDAALMKTLRLDPDLNPLLKLAKYQQRPGADGYGLVYPMMRPDEFSVVKFAPPSSMKPISFHPAKVLVSGIKRMLMSFN